MLQNKLKNVSFRLLECLDFFQNVVVKSYSYDAFFNLALVKITRQSVNYLTPTAKPVANMNSEN